MIDFTALAIEHDDLAIVFAVLAANLCEERRKSVIVIHRPAIEWVIVALSTLSANAHEDLGDIF
jgi:hypothetical protein